MYLFDTNEKRTIKHKRNKSKKLIHSAEAKAEAKAKKIQQDEMDALQITFYEIESWIEKTSPVLSRMTKELDKVSRHFDKKKRIGTPIKKENENSIQSTTKELLEFKDNLDVSSMQWSLSFQPGNSMRLETNIKSVEELIEAVKKIQIITESTTDKSTKIFFPHNVTKQEYEESEYASSSASSLSSIVVVDPSIEYWNNAMYRRPNTCSYKFKHGDMNLSKLTQDVSPTILSYICKTYWDCLHPKCSADWSKFWNRAGDPERNQVCIDSGLAIMFMHVIRHNKNASLNAQDIAYYYFGRSREALMDYFDSPDVTTIESLLNLTMFCVLCKRHSQSRMYISLAYRMIIQLNIHKMSTLLTLNRLQQKEYLQLYMVLFYNDVAVSIYSGEPTLIDDSVSDINFYHLLSLNTQLVEHQEANYDDKTIAKESFHVHLLELSKIGKRIQYMTQDYQRQNLQHHHSGILPLRWIKKIQELEIALASWFDKLPDKYRFDPKKENMSCQQDQSLADATMLIEQSGLLLMIQYQSQWIQLHKTFLSPNINHFSFSSNHEQDIENNLNRTNRSYFISKDAANRIVIMSEIITERFDWCVCQFFISCVYQASTVFCKSVINKDRYQKESKAMIQRITSVLAASKINYHGLPDDLTACLNDFLAENDILDDPDQSHKVVLNDKLFNSPNMYQHCLNQQLDSNPPFTLNLNPPFTFNHDPSSDPFSIKMENQDDIELGNKNWRCKFSSSNIAQLDHRIM